MFFNYLKAALRNLLRHKGYAFINIFGLAIGIACCILILLYVQDELSFDTHHERADRLYRLVTETRSQDRARSSVTTPIPLAPTLLNDFPEVAQAARFFNPDNPVPLVQHGERRFYEQGFFFADPGALEIFSFSLKEGNAGTALNEPFSVVITGEMAEKYFGNESPLGQTLTFKNSLDFEVTGVLDAIPRNTHLQFDFLASFSSLQHWLGEEAMGNWYNNMCFVYLLLPPDHDAATLEEKLAGFTDTYLGQNPDVTRHFYLQPLSRIHLYSQADYGIAGGGDIFYVYMFSSIAVIILLIACINFINLSTARSSTRAKEVGVRKVMGAEKSSLVMQFIGEAVLSALLALMLALVLVIPPISWVNSLLGKALTLPVDGYLLLVFLGITLFIGVLAGSYPAFILSSFRPAEVLKKPSSSGRRGFTLRKGLVVAQFAISITLLICTAFIYAQLDYMKNRSMGFDEEAVVVIPIRDESLRQSTDGIKNEVLQHPAVLQASAAALYPGGPVGRMRFRLEDNEELLTPRVLWGDHEFLGALGMELVAGRDFSRERVTDADEAFIVNETAVRQMGWKDPESALGKRFTRIQGSSSDDQTEGQIIGVVKDFHFRSLRSEIEPLVIHLWPWPNYILARIRADGVPDALAFLEQTWQTFDPVHPFEYVFLDAQFDALYRNEEQLTQIIAVFTILAIFVACLGLFGLISFEGQRRSKEIGVRKVFGASVSKVAFLLTKDLLVLVVVANVIAWPVAYFYMQSWLQEFAYHVEMNLFIFILGGALSLLIAFLTINYQAVKAAYSNPIEQLTQIIAVFTILAIFVACLGLFGLISFEGQRRSKEIGVRKVFGASVSKVAFLLTKDLLVLVVVANVIAWPVAYFYMQSWLQEFAYHVEMNLFIFILGGALSLLIAFLTINYQAVKAAYSNPIDVLRYE